MPRYVREYEQAAGDAAGASSEDELIERLFGNPIHTYNLMKRFSIDLKNIEADVRTDDWRGEPSSVVRILFHVTSNQCTCSL